MSMIAKKKSGKIVEMLGCYNAEELTEDLEHLTIVFSPASFPLKWSNSSLSANFLANYFENFFPTAEEVENDVAKRYPENIQTRLVVRDSINYIVNELMENAVKFHYNSELEIVFTLRLDREYLSFLATNSVNPDTMPKFYALIKRLTTEDPNELLIELLENAAANGKTTESGIGFVTIITNHNAKIGWKFETIQVKGASDKINVTTMVQLPVIKEF